MVVEKQTFVSVVSPLGGVALHHRTMVRFLGRSYFLH
jgi:hypothetical protein